MNLAKGVFALTLTTAAFAAVPEAAHCEKPFAAAFGSGGDLQISVRSGDIEIVGTDDTAVRVACETENSDRAREIQISFKPDGTKGELDIHGGPSNNVKIRIETPRHTNLRVRSPAGDLSVRGIRGDKDIRLLAGDLDIEVDRPDDYSRVEASVKAGDIQASAFGVHKGGLFRSYSKNNPAGKYKLKAALWAGDVRLR